MVYFAAYMIVKKWLTRARTRPYVYGAIAFGIVFFTYYFLFRNTSVPVQTLIVRPADLVRQVSVSGTVVAAQNVNLGFSQSGRIAHVYAVVGDKVRAGQVLAEIENGDLRANVLQKQATLQTQKAKLQSLQDGTRPEQLAITQSQITSDGIALDQANQGVINAIRDAYNKSDDAVRTQVDQFMSNPRGAFPQLNFLLTDSQLKVAVESDRQSIESMLVRWQGNIGALTPSSELGVAYVEATRNSTAVAILLSHASAALNSALAASSVTQTNIITWTTNIATARTNVNTSITALTTAVTAQKNAVATLDKDQKSLTLLQVGTSASDIAAGVAQVNAAQADLENAQAQLQKTLVSAPFSGIVTALASKVGEIVSGNTSQISMISEGTFQIESYVAEVDVALIAVGNSASTTLDAYGSDAPFDVTVISVNPAETIRNGVSTYKTVLQFLTTDSRIRSGMTANILITTERKPNVLAVPQRIVADKNNQKIVIVIENQKQVERVVTVGMVSSLGQIEIISGLRDGDEVVLKTATH